MRGILAAVHLTSIGTRKSRSERRDSERGEHDQFDDGLALHLSTRISPCGGVRCAIQVSAAAATRIPAVRSRCASFRERQPPRFSFGVDARQDSRLERVPKGVLLTHDTWGGVRCAIQVSAAAATRIPAVRSRCASFRERQPPRISFGGDARQGRASNASQKVSC